MDDKSEARKDNTKGRVPIVVTNVFLGVGSVGLVFGLLSTSHEHVGFAVAIAAYTITAMRIAWMRALWQIETAAVIEDLGKRFLKGNSHDIGWRGFIKWKAWSFVGVIATIVTAAISFGFQ